MADMNLALASSVDLDAVRKNNDRIENLSDVVRSMVKVFVNEIRFGEHAYFLNVSRLCDCFENVCAVHLTPSHNILVNIYPLPQMI